MMSNKAAAESHVVTPPDTDAITRNSIVPEHLHDDLEEEEEAGEEEHTSADSDEASVKSVKQKLVIDDLDAENPELANEALDGSEEAGIKKDQKLGKGLEVDDIQAKILALFSDGAAMREKPTAVEKIVRPRHIFLNTYQLGPIKSFSQDQVERCIRATLTDALKGKKYFPNKGSTLAGRLAEIIRDRVLTFNYDRYKIVTYVTIGPKDRQGVEIGSKCLWDHKHDSYAFATFENYYLFASACVYALYFE